MLGVIALALLAGGGYWAYTTQSKTSVRSRLQNNQIEGQIEQKAYTEDEVGQHNTTSDCWIIVEAAVYDLSGFLEEHQAKNEVFPGRCGTNATDLFTSGPQGSKSPYKDLNPETLPDYQIGKLED